MVKFLKDEKVKQTVSGQPKRGRSSFVAILRLEEGGKELRPLFGSKTEKLIEGFEIKNGVSVYLDVHATASSFLTIDADTKEEVFEFEVGAGLYDGKDITSVDNNSKCSGDDERKIKWCSPTLKYSFTFRYDKNKNATLTIPD